MVQKQTKISTPWTPPDFGDPHGLRNFVTFEPARRWRLKVIGHCTVREFFWLTLSTFLNRFPCTFVILRNWCRGPVVRFWGCTVPSVWRPFERSISMTKGGTQRKWVPTSWGGKWANRLIELLDGKWLITLSARTFDLLFETNLYNSQVICSSG